MSPRTLTPLALAALVLLSGSAFAVPAIDHGPPTDTDQERESFAPVPVYGPVLDEPIFTLLTHEPDEDLVYGPGLNEDHYDLRVLPDNWRQLTADTAEAADIDDDDGADIRNPWADHDSAPLHNAPSDDEPMVPCGCHTTTPTDDPANTAPTNPSGGDDAPNHGYDGDDVDNDDGMDGDDSDTEDTDADDSVDSADADSADADSADADSDDSDSDDSDADELDGDDSDADDSDGDDSDADELDGDDTDTDDSDADDGSVDDGDDSDN